MKEHGFLFVSEMIRALLDGRKTQTRRLITPRNSLINGSSPASYSPSWDEMDFADVFTDPGPSPAGNAGPYLKVACSSGEHAGTRHRIYPRVQVGDRIWVRETHAQFAVGEGLDRAVPQCVAYRATCDEDGGFDYINGGGDVMRLKVTKWTPSLLMPRWASRIVLEVVGIKPERVSAISEADARAEGVDGPHIGRWTDGEGATTPPLDEPARPWAHSFAVLWQSINSERAPWFTDPWVWAYEFRRVEAAC